jgi:fatty-acyl-CoA synthase
VGRIVCEHRDVRLAAAYGVPCAVSDELVMVAVKLREDAEFDPNDLYEFFERQVAEDGMDRKWFPDFVRVVDDFEYTNTQKILVRNLKREHFDLRRLPHARIFWTRRGDRAYRPFSMQDFEALYRQFEASERAELLDR